MGVKCIEDERLKALAKELAPLNLKAVCAYEKILKKALRFRKRKTLFEIMQAVKTDDHRMLEAVVEYVEKRFGDEPALVAALVAARIAERLGAEKVFEKAKFYVTREAYRQIHKSFFKRGWRLFLIALYAVPRDESGVVKLVFNDFEYGRIVEIEGLPFIRLSIELYSIPIDVLDYVKSRVIASNIRAALAFDEKESDVELGRKIANAVRIDDLSREIKMTQIAKELGLTVEDFEREDELETKEKAFLLALIMEKYLRLRRNPILLEMKHLPPIFWDMWYGVAKGIYLKS